MSNKYKHFDEAMPSGMLNTSMESKPPLNQAIKQKYSIKDLVDEEEIKSYSKIAGESHPKLSRRSSIEIEIDYTNNRNIIKEGSKTSLSPTTKQVLNAVNSTKSEKNFIDLNKSLAKLASRRVAGHSPDNSYGKYHKDVTKNLQFQVQILSSKKSWEKSPQDTPKKISDKTKNSSRKDLDQTPEMYFEKGGLNKNNVQFAPNLPKKELLIGNSIDLNKFKNNGPQHMPKDKYSKFQTEASQPGEYNEYESKNLAKFFSQGAYFTEGCEDNSENVIEVESDGGTEKKNVKNMDSDKINMRKYQAYKKNMRHPKTKKQVHIIETEPSQYPMNSLPKIPKPKKMMINTEPSETTIRIEKFYTQLEESNRKQNEQDHENYDPIHLNAISDGVEYSDGGVGFSALKTKQQNNKSRVLGSREPVLKSAKLKYKMKTEETDKIQSWKNELITIKKDIENRKHSFDEVNKFVSQLYEDESKQMRPSETKEKREIIPESAEKPSDEHPICKINLGKLNLDSTITFAPSVKTPNNISGIHNPKLTQEMRTTTDGNDEKSPGEGSADRSSPQNIKHIRTSYCEFTYETNEMNTSFADNISKDAISKPACCGYSKCQIF